MYSFEKILQKIDPFFSFLKNKIIPKKIFNLLNPTYHFILVYIGRVLYRYPAKKIKVIGVTGTKGKSSVIEILNSILEQAGKKTSLSSTIRIKIDDDSKPNKFKMTSVGRFLIQEIIRKAVDKKCDFILLEVTSQSTLQSRHRFLQFDGVVFTNIHPEHIESHGSFEKYLNAKLNIARQLEVSKKPMRVVVSNLDDKHGKDFFNVESTHKIGYSIDQLDKYEIKKDGVSLVVDGIRINSKLKGKFNLYNIMAAIATAQTFGIDMESIKKGVEKLEMIRGRVEFIDVPKKNIEAVVDYAHTPESLEEFYQIFDKRHKVCVIGSCGGGRDKHKRKSFGEIANKYCDKIIITDEDPYDEDPTQIMLEILDNVKDKTKAEIESDRRVAIHKALKSCPEGGVVLVTGKGTDPYIMVANNKKIPWDDATVVREEADKL